MTYPPSPQTKDWLRGLGDQVAGFVDSLTLGDAPGRFLPCLEGVTPQGREAGLGFTCFALKTYWTVGHWANLAPERRQAMIRLIRSYQSSQGFGREPMTIDAFLDPPVIRRAFANFGPWARLKHRLTEPRNLTEPQRTTIAETKQAISSLREVGEKPHQPYTVWPRDPEGVTAWLERLPWRAPWGAGAQSCQLSAFLRTQGPELLPPGQVEKLCDTAYAFLGGLAHRENGAYYQGELPERGQLINGAMKVLTALDWLERPIHDPASLIDLCLMELPSPQGCHLVDLVYVLHRCLAQQNHRRDQVQDYCLDVLAMIQKHQKPSGGFSYYLDKSQLQYYGLPISQGLNEADIHGTVLLTWAVAMIAQILDFPLDGWRVLKP